MAPTNSSKPKPKPKPKPEPESESQSEPRPRKVVSIAGEEVDSEQFIASKQPARNFSRPTGTDRSRAVEITNLSSAEKSRISQQHGLEGVARRDIALENQKAEIQNQLQQERAKSLQPIIGQVAQPMPEQTIIPGSPVNPLTPEQAKELTNTTPPQQTLIGKDEATSLALGGTSIGAGAATGAGLGATAGAAFAGVGAVPGAIIGGVAGGASAGLAKISFEKRENVAVATKNYKLARSNMKTIINQVNAGMMSPEDAVVAWNDQLNTINIAHRNLKLETSTSLARFLSGGRVELTEIQNFKDNEELFFTNRLQAALLSPNPNSIFMDLQENEAPSYDS